MKTLIFTATLLSSGVISEARANSPSTALKLIRSTYESVQYWYGGRTLRPTKSELNRLTVWLFGFKAKLVDLELDASAVRQLRHELARINEGDDAIIWHMLHKHADLLDEAQPEVRVVDAWHEVDMHPRDYGFRVYGHAAHLHEGVGNETAVVFAASGLSDIAELVIENKALLDTYTDLVVKERRWSGIDALSDMLADAKQKMHKTAKERGSLYYGGNVTIDDILMDSIYAAYKHLSEAKKHNLKRRSPLRDFLNSLFNNKSDPAAQSTL